MNITFQLSDVFIVCVDSKTTNYGLQPSLQEGMGDEWTRVQFCERAWMLTVATYYYFTFIYTYNDKHSYNILVHFLKI